jgi:hypothetical protein
VSWETLPELSTFPQARRKELARRLGRLVLGRDPDNLLSLDEVQARLQAYEQWYVGIRTIKVSQIVGSVDRTADFDREFLPKRQNMEPRWKRVEQVFQTEAFPPIIVFKVGEAYFVEDGHHRVAIARQRKTEFIDADITEVNSPVPITPDVDVAGIIHQGLRLWFMRESGLDLVRPQAVIEPSRPHSYAELLDIVQASGFELMMERQTVLAPAVAAAHWHDHLYVPAVELIRARGLPKLFPKSTDTDLYLRVHSQHRELVGVGGSHTIDDAVVSTESEKSKKLTAKTRRAVEDVVEDVKVAVDDIKEILADKQSKQEP